MNKIMSIIPWGLILVALCYILPSFWLSSSYVQWSPNDIIILYNWTNKGLRIYCNFNMIIIFKWDQEYGKLF